MKVIIAGSRGLAGQKAQRLVVSAMRAAGYGSLFDTQDPEWAGTVVTEVVSGGAYGIDKAGEDWAVVNWVPIRLFLPEWGKYGKRAGVLRNEDMGRYADALVAIRLNNSRGTTHMIEFMRSLGKPVYILDITYE